MHSKVQLFAVHGESTWTVQLKIEVKLLRKVWGRGQKVKLCWWKYYEKYAFLRKKDTDMKWVPISKCRIVADFYNNLAFHRVIKADGLGVKICNFWLQRLLDWQPLKDCFRIVGSYSHVLFLSCKDCFKKIVVFWWLFFAILSGNPTRTFFLPHLFLQSRQ